MNHLPVVFSVSIIALGLAFGSSQTLAAACALPLNDTDVTYEVYHETSTLAGVIDSHFQTTELLFRNAGLLLKFTSGGLPNPRQLSPEQAGLAKELLDEVVGPDAENAIEDFKSEATDQGIYQPDLVNVYYIDVEHLTGMHLRNRDGFSHNIILMGQGFKDDTLAHEFGHAMSLAHVNFWSHDDPDAGQFPNGVQVEYCVEHGYFDNECNFDAANLMWAAVDSRSTLAPGQRDRVACNETSALVANGDYDPGPTKFNCPDWSKENPCPVLH